MKQSSNRPVEQGKNQPKEVELKRSDALDQATENAISRMTAEFGNALDRSNEAGEMKGRLAALEQQVRHQEVRTDARFDKAEAKVEAGFSKVDSALAELTKVVININRKMATNEGERKGVVGTAMIVSTVVGGLFALLQFGLSIYFKIYGGG